MGVLGGSQKVYVEKAYVLFLSLNHLPSPSRIYPVARADKPTKLHASIRHVVLKT